VGGPDNPTTNKVAQMYAQRIDGEVKIGNMPRGMLKVMSTLMKPFQPGMSQIYDVRLPGGHPRQPL
jgi:hypothetical protein